MKIVSDTAASVNLTQMKDGEIGIITKFQGSNEYVGEIVQRYGTALVVLGKPSGKSWCNIFTCSLGSLKDIYVRILSAGTVIEI